MKAFKGTTYVMGPDLHSCLGNHGVFEERCRKGEEHELCDKLLSSQL